MILRLPLSEHGLPHQRIHPVGAQRAFIPHGEPALLYLYVIAERIRRRGSLSLHHSSEVIVSVAPRAGVGRCRKVANPNARGKGSSARISLDTDSQSIVCRQEPGRKRGLEVGMPIVMREMSQIRTLRAHRTRRLHRLGYAHVRGMRLPEERV